MKKVFLLLSILLLTNCNDIGFDNDCFRNVRISGTINLSLPAFINLQVPGGYTTTRIQTRNILIINTLTSGYKAFDLECPEKDCSSDMEYDGLFLTCPCSDKEYNSLNGSPQDGEGCFALEYNVLQSSNNTLQISK